MVSTLQDRVIADCGISDPKEDLDLEQEDFEALVDTYIDATTEWIDTYVQKQYSTYPAGLQQIVVEIVCNIIRNKVIRQGTAINEGDDESKNYVEREITSDIQLRLKPYIGKMKIRVMGI